MQPRGSYAYTRTVIPPTTKVVRWLLILNIGIYILQILFLNRYLAVLGLVPSAFLSRGFLWQIITYLFLHGNPLHILFNMVFLWMMGPELERYWGGREFLKYYLITGGGAGLVNVLVQPASMVPTIGASGAIFGVIIAFALAFPDREMLLYFVIRIKAKHFAVLVGTIELLSLFLLPSAPIARFAHLGGLAVGYVYLKRERLGYRLKRRMVASQRTLAESARRREQARRARHRAEIDRILEKISTRGLGSLTDQERNLLERESGGKP